MADSEIRQFIVSEGGAWSDIREFLVGNNGTSCPVGSYWNGVECRPESERPACAIGYIYSPDKQMCVLGIPAGECPGSLLPEKPDAPSYTKKGGEATLTFTKWPANADKVYLLQEGKSDPINSWTEVEGASSYSFTVKPLADYQTYGFRLVGENTSGRGPVSDLVEVEMISDALTITWVNPIQDQVIFGVVGLVVKVEPAVSLVRISAQQGSLPRVKRQKNSNLYHTTYDSRYADLMGVMTFTADAVDDSGLPTRPVKVQVTLSNTLARLTHYEHFSWTEPDGKLLRTLLLATIVDNREPKQWVDALVSSPGKLAALPYSDYAEMEKELRTWQVVPFDDPFELVANKKNTDRVEVVLRFTPPRLETVYPTGSTGGRRLRQVSPELIEILTSSPSKVFIADGDGLKLKLNLSERGFAEATDAKLWRGDKVVTIQDKEVKVCELDASSADWYVRMDGEPKTPFAVEADGDFFYLVYTSTNLTTVWKHDGTDPVKVAELNKQVYLVRHSGNAIGLVSLDNTVHQLSLEEKILIPLRKHTETVTDLLIENGLVIGYSDDDEIFTTINGSLSSLVSSPESITCIGKYKGFALVKGLTAGVNASRVYSIDPNGGFVPTWNFYRNAVSVKGVGSLDVTYVPEEGNPLMDGKPAIETEILVSLISSSAPQGGYVSYIERSKKTSETSILVGGIERVVLLPENQQAKPKE